MKRWFQKWLGINPDLEQQRYIATQAQLSQLARGLSELTEINTKLTETAEKLAGQVKLNSDEIAGIKIGYEYHTKEIYELKKIVIPASKPATKSKAK